MVCIAESFHYLVFERKWRSGAALLGPSPCMPYSQCRFKKPKHQKTLFYSFFLMWFLKFANKTFCFCCDLGLLGVFPFKREISKSAQAKVLLVKERRKFNKNNKNTNQFCVAVNFSRSFFELLFLDHNGKKRKVFNYTFFFLVYFCFH